MPESSRPPKKRKIQSDSVEAIRASPSFDQNLDTPDQVPTSAAVAQDLTATNTTVEVVASTSHLPEHSAEEENSLMPEACPKCKEHIRENRNLKRRLNRLKKKVDIVINLNKQALVNVSDFMFLNKDFITILNFNSYFNFRNLMLRKMRLKMKLTPQISWILEAKMKSVVMRKVMVKWLQVLMFQLTMIPPGPVNWMGLKVLGQSLMMIMIKLRRSHGIT